MFNIANPLKKSRVLDLGGGKSDIVLFHYERVQKRCFSCQPLNHEKNVYPLEMRKRQKIAKQRRENRTTDELSKAASLINRDYPLIVVLEESQVGLNPFTGRPKISQEVLEEMRLYLLDEGGEDRAVKIDRLQRTVKEAEQDPDAPKALLSLKPVPVLTLNLNKGKGPVFDYNEKEVGGKELVPFTNPNKLLAGAIKDYKPSCVSSLPYGDIWVSEDQLLFKCDVVLF
ncbi:hypothetical protein Bca4012_038081 [Brassica carinata]